MSIELAICNQLTNVQISSYYRSAPFLSFCNPARSSLPHVLPHNPSCNSSACPSAAGLQQALDVGAAFGVTLLEGGG
ncbi:MAG: hypothetical protein IPN33_23020 [Saprospiraceae bacterium]|nr:hypothetical protein [Saprospiraceae bacterium]